VFVTLNTLLHDHELSKAVQLVHQLYQAGVDALIVQDMGLLENDLPPLPLIASTQMHNDTPAKVAFLEQVGFQRVILARELSLAQIAAIRQQTTIELEAFVHGALCVSYSGQCYMSYAIGGRSGNRGECAQPCRRRYDLVDAGGEMLARGKHLLSLKDLNLSEHLADLIRAGVCSLKVEGRLKDRSYVMNVVSAYRRQLDQVLRSLRLSQSSSGQSQIDFEPDLTKTFNRGYTTYYLYGRNVPPGSPDSPKMMGEFVGQVISRSGRSIALNSTIPLHSGDGLCFLDASGTLRGTVVTSVRGQTITAESPTGVQKGTRIYRNHDHAFLSQLSKARPQRTVAVRLRLGETPTGFTLSATDEDGIVANSILEHEKVKAEKPKKALDSVHRQLAKMGGTEFVCKGIEIDWQEPFFVPLSALNALRRDALARLVLAREENRPVFDRTVVKNDVPYPQAELTYTGNVLNRHAAAFYRRHGVTQIERAAESGMDMQGRQVMRTRYCIRDQLGLCRQESVGSSLKGPLYLVDEDGHRYRLGFDCDVCEMRVCF
jgi:putative protease